MPKRPPAIRPSDSQRSPIRIVVDPRGQGLLTKTVHGNDYVTYGSDVQKLIDGLGLQNVTLVGWSNGNLEVWSYLEQAGYEKDLRQDNIKQL